MANLSTYTVECYARIFSESLDNERIVDNVVARQYLSAQEVASLPEFKQLKLSPLKKRLRYVFYPILIFGVIAVWPKLMFEFIYYIVIKIFCKKKYIEHGSKVYISFVESRQDLLRKVVYEEEGYPLVGLSRLDLVGHVRFRSLFFGFAVIFKLMMSAIFRPWRDAVSFSLHAHNSASIILACLFLESRSDLTVVTSSIMQRWLYVFGHIGRRVWAVQHGYVRGGVLFRHQFSDIERIYAFSEVQVSRYEQYYKAREIKYIESGIKFEEYEGCSDALFLASSFPFIDEEIALLSVLRAAISVPIAIKLHPRHLYDNRAKDLIALSDIVVPSNVDPRCAVFLSHSSSYGFFYERSGIPNVAFSEFENIGQVLTELRGLGVLLPEPVTQPKASLL